MLYGYIRVSTASQIDGTGLQVQEDAIKNYCEKNGIVLDGMFSDAGISGTTLDRSGLQDLLTACENNPASKIIVLNVSRLWRSDIAGGFIRYNLTNSKTDIISLQEPNYTLYEVDPANFLITQVMQALAQYDRMLINSKLATARKRKACNGDKSCGAVPLGYTWNNKKVEIDSEADYIINDIFKRFSECGSFQKVAEYCNRKGYKTKTGKDFNRQGIHKIITNDFYIGIVTHDSEKTKGNHKPIVKNSLFMKCNPNYTS